MDSNNEAINSFVAVTGSSLQEAKFYLESHQGNLQQAISQYLAVNSSSSSSSAPTQQQQQAVRVPVASSTSNRGTQPPNTRGGIRGFSDFNTKEDEDEDSVKWFTGGEKSGLQVQAPVNKKALIEGVLKGAQEQGAKNIEEYNEESGKDQQKAQTFSGSGYRLGHTTGLSAQVKSATAPPPAQNTKKLIRKKICLWKNGFTVDNGPLRSYYDPANQTFMKKIQTGELPSEFAKEAQQAEIDVDILDKSGEDYQEPPKVIQPFSGSGQKLGSVSATPTPSPQTSTPVATGPKITIDSSQPTTSIQIRLADGQRIVGTFNHSHTIHDIKTYINSTQPTTFSYDLMTAFPQAVLANETQSIKDAGLINSVVIQKRK